jgi:hypothetical protein
MRSVFLLLCILTSELAAQTQSLESLFPRDRIIEVAITIDEDDWDTIRQQSRGFFDVLHPSRQFGPVDSPYSYVPAHVTIDGVEYSRIGLRKKGFIGSLDDSRPSLKLKINKYDRGTSIGGLTSLTLNNNKQDRSLMSQFIGYDLFNKAGSPAPRCAFAHVTVNGKNLGVYSHVESVRDPLLKREFGNADGTLFEGSVVDFFDAWDQSFELKTGPDEPGRIKINQLIDALEDDDIDLNEIWGIVDEESFYRFWAVEGLLSFWDGYSGNRNNFFIYLNPTTDRIHFMPWGADCMFEKYSQLGEDPKSPRAVRLQGLLANRLYQVPSVRKKYARTMRKLLDQVWDEDALLAETERIEAMVTPHLAKSQRRVKFDAIRGFIRNRRGDVEPEVSGRDMPNWKGPIEPPPVLGGGNPEGSFWAAAKTGDLEELRSHIKKGQDVNQLDTGGGSAIMLAALAGETDAIRMLLANGADVNIANRDGNTPLHGAAFFGEVEVVELLLNSKADPNPKNNELATPLDSAAAPWNAELEEIVQFIARIVNIEPDMAKIRAGRPKVARMLEQHGGKHGGEIKGGGSIWVSAKTGDLQGITAALDGGADPNEHDPNRITPLCWAAMTGQIDAARLLIDGGADLNRPNGDGGTPLHGAAFFGRTPMVKLLIEKGANVKARNDKGESPLDNVTIPWNQEIAGIMLWIGGLLEIEVNPAAAHAAWPKIADLLRGSTE